MLLFLKKNEMDHTINIYETNTALQFMGTTKFCEDVDPLRRIINSDLEPYTGVTNCFQKRFNC